MTRSYIHLLHGDWKEAAADHPLFMLVPLALLVAYKMYGTGDDRRRKVILSLVLAGLAAVFIGVYIYRMILYFPHTEPMTFYEDGIIPGVYRMIRNLGLNGA